MCGIAGVAHFDDARPAIESQVRRMIDTLVHRGPDGGGCTTRDNVCLGHRRLSIIDLSTGGQPLTSHDGNLVLTYNGELYNYIEIREELIGLGHRFRTQSDTEVVLHAYEEWGTACLARFNGMWAFALWDVRQRRLFCARDRMGEKPFFYSVFDESFFFGSEIKALFAAGLSRQINEEVLDALLCFTYLPAPYTMYKGIHKLPAGCFLTVHAGRVHVQRYWQVSSRPRTEMRRDSGIIYREFEALFEDSVRLRMRSDVPVGAFLSGGLDSASVVAAMSVVTRQPIRTCTIGFDEGPNDERPLARLVAEAFKTNHVEQRVHAEHADALLEKLAWHFDEPFGDTSALPTYVVSKVARDLVTVVLTGDGGDEVLGGYPVHQSEKLIAYWQLLPAFLRGSASRMAERVFAATGLWNRSASFARLGRVLPSANSDFLSRLESKQVGFGATERRLLLGDNRNIRPARNFIEEALTTSVARDGLGLLNFWLHTVALPERYLCKVDRCSMAHSLEARVPFLDHRLVELLADVHPRVKMPGLTRKNILRQTMGKRLPAALLKAPKKGFDPPANEWLADNTYWDRRIPALRESGLFSVDLENLARHEQASASPSMGLWTLAMFSLQLEPRASQEVFNG